MRHSIFRKEVSSDRRFSENITISISEARWRISLKLKEKAFLCAADSNNIEPTKLQSRPGMDQSRRLTGSNYEKGLSIVNQFNCNEVYVYAMGQEPWATYALSLKYTEELNAIVHSNKLVESRRSKGITAERLFGKKELLYLN